MRTKRTHTFEIITLSVLTSAAIVTGILYTESAGFLLFDAPPSHALALFMATIASTALLIQWGLRDE